MKQKHELAYDDYKSGMKYKDIAEKYEVSLSAVKSWKNRYWAKEKLQPKNKKVAERLQPKSTKVAERLQPKIDEIESLNESDLTDKQKLFCVEFIKCFNATKAYKRVYGCSYNSAMSNASELLRNTKVKNEIQRLKKAKLNRAMLSEDDVFQKMIDIAFADITDYGDFTSEGVLIKNSKDVDGSLISEIRNDDNGVRIKLLDKISALKWLGDRMDLIPTAVRMKLDIELAKMEKESQATETDKDNNDLLDALGSVSEVMFDEQ